MKGMHVRKKAAWWPVIFLCLFSIMSASALLGYQPPDPGGSSPEITGAGRISNVLSMLEFKNANRKVLDKAAGKMYTMNEQELRLISSLCDRVSAKSETAGADIAFSLITALLVLS